jgi:demethylmenaquinone methyltransferase/2-methoxy-6-polyprenyl-1,4-benzoquinol methylase
MDLPDAVTDAQKRAETISFPYSCDPGTGRMLAVLAASVCDGGRVLEIGTGVGAGCAWIIHGLGVRNDVELVSIENDPDIASVAASARWPDYVRLLVGDALELLPSAGRFDLIFADAPAGKWTGLGRTIDALQPRGMLIVDDMIPTADQPAEWRQALERTRGKLMSSPDLIIAEIDDLTGVILAVKQ